jgi:calcium-dependent protein kinase
MLDRDEIDDLGQLFMLLDENCDGKLSRDELLKGFVEHGLGDPTQIDEIISECDINGDGYLEYTEFIAATMNKKKMLSQKKLKEAFNLFDVDRNGVISFEELSDVLGNTGNVVKIFREADTNKDGLIDFEEFEFIMQKMLDY